MPQSTNLNKSPYFDDFSQDKNYHKVLFKPGVTVQTRELTTLQSILQDQLEKFGNGVFSDGGMVVPGGFNYDSNFTCVEIEDTYKGVDTEAYYENLIGKKIKGKITGIIAKVVKVLSRVDSERNNTTLYVKYISSSDNQDSDVFTKEVFDDGEELITLSDITVGSSLIATNSEFARVVALPNRRATSTGSSANIVDGIYFIRGFFVNVYSSTIILDQYTNSPSYRIGLEVVEDLVDSNEDSSLNDNAQGFSNFAAPGADRLKISLNLIKKSLTDYNDDSFIELFRVQSGELISIKRDDKYSFITDILAKRTYDESGNYYVNPFDIEALDSLNDNLGNGGLYQETQKTSGGSTPSSDLGILKISAGKAYVKGYEVPSSTKTVDFPKSRDVKEIQSSSSSFYGGDLLKVNNVLGVPNIGLTTTFSVSLLNQRLENGVGIGTTIGFARVYDFESNNTSYQNPSSEFNLYLFDIQTYTNITFSSAISGLTVGSYIKGKNTGSYGYVKEINSANVKLYQVSGSFNIGESVYANGILKTETITNITDYSIDDIKSVVGYSGVSTFSADTVLSKKTEIRGPFNFTFNSPLGIISIDNGISFASNLKVNDVIEYSTSGNTSPVYAGITSIFSTKNKIVVAGVSTVSNVCTGNIGVSSSYTIQNIRVLRPQIITNTENSSLYTELTHRNIADINTLNSNIYIKKQYNNLTKSSTTLTLPNLVGDYVYPSFDEERYIVVNADGTVENLSTATLTRTSGNKNATFTGLSSTAGPCRVITTQIKSNVTNKFKKLNKCSSAEIVKTKYSTPPNAGLTSSTVYGTRVEDQEICLNYSDIIEVHGVFESTDSSSPALTYLTLAEISGPNSNTNDLIVGELIVGQDSGAVAIYAEQKTTSQVYVIYKNDKVFNDSEKIKFNESGLEATVSSTTVGNTNILNDFILDNGQRKHFYDFGRLIRKNYSKEPSHRLKVYFDRFSYEPTDNGDVITVNSYPTSINKNKIASYSNVRNLDAIDVRPRVIDYNTSSAVSPFEFGSRNFSGSGSNAYQILAANEDFVFDYSFYLPRVDKLTLSKEGMLDLVIGQSSENPKIPKISPEVLDLATIKSLPYVYDIDKDVEISLTNNKRFTMSDLRDIESRVSSLEYYTSLSLLELSTQNLLIEDEDGFNRFKSGFFVDNFSSYDFSDVESPIYRSEIDNNTLSSPVVTDRVDLTMYSDDSQDSIVLSETNSNNLRLTGNTLTLNYTEIAHVNQSFASRIANVNPYGVISWSGNLVLNPSRDSWSITISGTTTRVPDVGRRGSTSTFTTQTNIPYVRSRNIEFITSRLKPNTRFKLVFDSRDLTSTNTYAFPKLIEVSNVSGSFVVGETVAVYDPNRTNVICQFRLCTGNHKYGPHNSPTSVYSKNPYNPSVGISSIYGPQSTLLNVDTSSLQISNVSNFYGNILKNSILVGRTSGANAKVSNHRLVSDDSGELIGSIFVPDPNTNELKFRTGSTSVQVIQYTSTGFSGEKFSAAETVFTSSGAIVRTNRIDYYDPLAQTFIVSDENGIFPSSVDVYFSSKDSTLPVSLQVREVFNGIPGGPDKIVGTLEKVLEPSEVNVSSNATSSTTFRFDNLTRLEGGKEYALVLLSDSADYNVWVSRIGDVEISTANRSEVQKIIINKQPTLGSLFSSQNGTTWTPIQTDDLKFKLNKCKFDTRGGVARFYNSDVYSTSLENKLPENPISMTIGGSAPNDGYYMLVNHPNHGMNSSTNKVNISGVISDILPTTLSAGYGLTTSGPISVTDSTIFENFEGDAVGPLNVGYIEVNGEIMKYEGVSPGQLTTVTRGINNTLQVEHPQNSLVYKYEFNQISLTGINTEHSISGVGAIGLDSYYIQINSGVGKSFTSSKFGGGSSVYASKNKLYNSVGINSEFIETYNGTTCTGSIRSISAQSISGNETAFADKGYESVNIDGTTTFTDLRMVASKENESQYLNSTQFVGSKSVTLEFNLGTSDANVSPIIDTNSSYLTTKNYRINQPIVGIAYSTDNTVNSNIDDPHSFIHITDRVDLSQSANALKVIFDGYRPAESDIRVLYKIYRNDSPDEDQIWELFPGYDNLNIDGSIKISNANSGSSDKLVPISRLNEYLEYQFTMNNLPDFTGFAIKIIGSSTSQAKSPSIKNLRVIAIK
jgi:hypothetical protein